MTTTTTAPKLHWTTHSPAPGLTVALLDGEPTSVGGDAGHGSVVSGFRPVRVGLWYGPGEDLTRWRDGVVLNPGAAIGAESAATVCGQPASRLEVTTPTRAATDVTYVDGRHGNEPNPGETFVAVAFHHHELPVVAFYVVETEQRRTYAADEAHFFASIVCE